MLRLKNRRYLQRRGWVAFENDDLDPAGDDPSGEPEPSNPSGGGSNPSNAARRVGDKTSMKKELGELRDSMAEIRALLKSRGEADPPKEDKKKPATTDDAPQLKASLDALQTRLNKVASNLAEQEAVNKQLMQESMRSRFVEAVQHPEMETPVKPGLAKFLFNELEGRLAFDPNNPSNIRIRHKDPATGKVSDKAFQETVDAERNTMRPVTLVEFLNEELPKPEYKDFWAVPGTQDPGFHDAKPGLQTTKSKLSPEEQYDESRIKERADPGAMARNLARARAKDAAAAKS